VVNSITGGDPVTARFNFYDEFQFNPKFKLFISGNDRPNIEGTNYGTWRRIRLIKFEVKFDEQNGKIKNLQEVLLKELPGILNWLIKGCLRWQKEGLEPPEKAKEATASYETESDLFKLFLDGACGIDKSEETVTSHLYARFVAWCSSEGFKPLGKKVFNGRMEGAGFTKRRKRGQDWWIGVGEKKQQDSDSPEAPDTESLEEESNYQMLL